MPVSRSLPRGGGELVQAKRRLFNVALGSDAMPPVVIQWEVGFDGNLQRAVTHVEGEEDLGGSWKTKSRRTVIKNQSQQHPPFPHSFILSSFSPCSLLPPVHARCWPAALRHTHTHRQVHSSVNIVRTSSCSNSHCGI